MDTWTPYHATNMFYPSCAARRIKRYLLCRTTREVIMKNIGIVLAVFLVAITKAIAVNTSGDDKIYFEGVNAGMMSKHEGEVVDAYNGLSLLGKVEGAESYRKLLVTQLNTALFAMSFVDRDVKV